jgi:hypothetical protein
MRRSILLYFAFILLLTLTRPVYASVELEAIIDQNVQVTLDLRNINSTIYEIIKEMNLINEIESIIIRNLEEKGLENVNFGLPSEPLTFNDAEKTVSIRFHLSGSDILSFAVSTETARRTCRVRTDWRKFELNITDVFLLNFTEYFGRPISEWNFENKTYPTYYHNYIGTIPLDPACYFKLPKEAIDVHVEGETIVFELSLSLADSLLSSPFLILGAIIVAIIIASLYRTVRKSEEQRLES